MQEKLSNCIAWAIGRHITLMRRWWADGRRVGYEPALRIRPSRLEPRKVPHFAVEHWTGEQWVREEWVPLDKRPLPWYLLWRALYTRGEIVVEVLTHQQPGSNG